MKIKEIYNLLGNDDAIIKISLLAGFIQVMRCSDFKEHPLTAICCAIIVAIIYSAIAKIIINISPEFLKPFISLALIISIIYYIGFKKNCKSNPVFHYSQKNKNKESIFDIKI